MHTQIANDINSWSRGTSTESSNATTQISMPKHRLSIQARQRPNCMGYSALLDVTALEGRISTELINKHHYSIMTTHIEHKTFIHLGKNRVHTCNPDTSNSGVAAFLALRR
jgi:hypothetical protein